MCLRFSVRNGSSSRRRRSHRTHDSVDGVAAAELFYGDLGSSAGDYRAVGLSDLRRGGPTAAGVVGGETGCASCLSCDPSSGGKQRTVVCTVQNTRTATLVHRLDAASKTGPSAYGYAADGGVCLNGQPRTSPGRASTYATKQEIYCHSPYCIYATSGTSRRLQTFKKQANAAPDVAVYGSERPKEPESGVECGGLAEAEQLGDAVEAEVSGQLALDSPRDVAERWLRSAAAAGDDDGDEPMEGRSRRPSEGSSPPSPINDVTPRPAADVLDILGLAVSSPPSATSVGGRRVLNGLLNDHLTNNNNYNSNNNSVAS